MCSYNFLCWVCEKALRVQKMYGRKQKTSRGYKIRVEAGNWQLGIQGDCEVLR